MYAEKKAHAEQAIEQFAREFGVKYPKALDCLKEPALLTFFDFPAEHWVHLRTTNVIESPFATVRLRERVTKGAGTRNKALLMAFKLLDMAQLRCRKINGTNRLKELRQRNIFVDGVIQKVEHKPAA